jgi:hypothetical protein
MPLTPDGEVFVRLYLLAIVIVLVVGPLISSAQEVITPKPGSALRKAILNAVREPVQNELGMEVQFKVNELRTDGEWAFLNAVPLTKDYKRIDYVHTKYAKEVREGLFDDWLCALVRKQPDQSWTVIALSIGATDVPFVDWPRRFDVPRTVVIPTAGPIK